jgi:polysaccharide biosynthesis transport protein
MSSTRPELAHYLSFVRRHWLLLVLGTVIGLACAAGWHAQQSPTYTSTASVLLTPVPGFVDTDPSGRAPRPVTIDTDAQLAVSSTTVGAVARATGDARAVVAAGLNLSAPPLTRVLRISYTSPQPRKAHFGAGAATRSLIASRREFLGAVQLDQIARLQLEVARRAADLERLEAAGASLERRGEAQEQLGTLRTRLTDLYVARSNPGEVLEAARRPTAADPTDPEVALASGALLGLSLALGVAWLYEARHRRRAANRSSTRAPKRSAASVAEG